MFIANVHGKESINALADQLGCKAGECLHGAGYGRPGVIGNTFAIKEQLKAAGAKFDGKEKAWTFDSWAQLEAALLSVLAVEA